MTSLPAAVALVLLTDSRLPAGGHAHSGGMEAALDAGLVHDPAGLAGFLRGRLWTAGLVAAGLAAAAARLAGRSTVDAGGGAGPVDGGPAPDGVDPRPAAAAGPSPATGASTVDSADAWAELDAEADARTPSPAQRAASRQQGRALLRAGRAAWPGPVLAGLSALDLPAGPGGPTGRAGTAGRAGGPHHPVALGAVSVAAGGDTTTAALAAGYLAVSGPATAAIRLRGFDPLLVHAVLAGLAGDIAAVADRAVAAAAGLPADLPCPAAPRLDLLAELHARSEVRLFAS
ncbi:MAG TPA: urease accessory UreF family protein [Mycobacteriales bacterium]|nr:urease accessory UreF family protein [Mycobacteriales bacterium]